MKTIYHKGSAVKNMELYYVAGEQYLPKGKVNIRNW